MEDNEILLTGTEVARLYRVSQVTVARWRRSGKLPATLYTMGGHARFALSSLDEDMQALWHRDHPRAAP